MLVFRAGSNQPKAVPLSLVTTVRLKPVSICVTVTVTPGSTALLSSVTRPQARS